MKTQVNDSAAEQELRQLIETWSQAVKRQDIEQILAIYAKDVVAFDAIGELQFKGLDSYAAHWRACMAIQMPGYFASTCRQSSFQSRETIKPVRT